MAAISVYMDPGLRTVNAATDTGLSGVGVSILTSVSLFHTDLSLLVLQDYTLQTHHFLSLQQYTPLQMEQTGQGRLLCGFQF